MDGVVPVLLQLVTPLQYLRIKHPLKWIVDVLVPGVLAIAVTWLIANLPLPISIFGDSGLVALGSNLIAILVGFYIAALAAVATFDRPGMDEPLAGDPALLPRGPDATLTLTRRQFLCYMFGYLALTSLFLYFGGGAANLLAKNVSLMLAGEYHFVAQIVFVGCYSFLLAHLMAITLMGLHFLTDRIHR